MSDVKYASDGFSEHSGNGNSTRAMDSHLKELAAQLTDVPVFKNGTDADSCAIAGESYFPQTDKTFAAKRAFAASLGLMTRPAQQGEPTTFER